MRSILLGVLPALLVAGLAAGSSPTSPIVTPAQVKTMQALIPKCESEHDHACVARGYPSLAEARVFCDGAGLADPVDRR